MGCESAAVERDQGREDSAKLISTCSSLLESESRMEWDQEVLVSGCECEKSNVDKEGYSKLARFGETASI